MFQCNICGKQCKNPNALRWHFDKCQRNSQKNSQLSKESEPSDKIEPDRIELSDKPEKESFWDRGIFSGWFG